LYAAEGLTPPAFSPQISLSFHYISSSFSHSPGILGSHLTLISLYLLIFPSHTRHSHLKSHSHFTVPLCLSLTPPAFSAPISFSFPCIPKHSCLKPHSPFTVSLHLSLTTKLFSFQISLSSHCISSSVTHTTRILFQISLSFHCISCCMSRHQHYCLKFHSHFTVSFFSLTLRHSHLELTLISMYLFVFIFSCPLYSWLKCHYQFTASLHHSLTALSFSPQISLLFY
jgi:hypothetical protein